MTLLLTFNLSMAVYIAYVFALSHRYYHMLQLNSYYNDRYWKWFRENFKKEVSAFSMFPIMAPCFILLHRLPQYFIFWVVAIAASLYVNLSNTRRQAEKKKFVYTGRVIRMYVTQGVLLLILTGMGNLLVLYTHEIFPILLLTALAAMTEFKVCWPIVTNTVNAPIERAVRNHYIRDARRILDEADGLKVIGITGSYGKTSCKYILTKLLSEKYNVLMTPESYNTPMGVVRTVREQWKPGTRIFVCEMGAKRPGDIREICDIVHPDIGWITAVGAAHLESFGSLENTARTKYELVDALPSDGLAVLNYDNEIIASRGADRPRLRYGIENPELDFWAQDLSYGRSGASFTLCSNRGLRLPLRTRLLGRHNILNITGAAALALHEGVSEQQIAYALERLKPVPHRLEIHDRGSEIIVIDDAFNSNPEGAAEALHVLGSFESPMKILISPGMIELGDREQEENRLFGERAAAVCDYVIPVGTRRSKPIVEGLRAAGFDEQKLFVAKNLKDALGQLTQIAVPGSVVLLENDLPDDLEE